MTPGFESNDASNEPLIRHLLIISAFAQRLIVVRRSDAKLATSHLVGACAMGDCSNIKQSNIEPMCDMAHRLPEADVAQRLLFEELS